MKRVDQQEDHFNFKDNKPNNAQGRGRIITALIFILAGVLIISQRSGFISYELFRQLFNWQMLLIGIGIVSIAKHKGSIGGFIMIMVGGVFLIPEYVDLSLDMRQMLWPAILIGVGLIILFNGFGSCKNGFKHRFRSGNIDDMDVVNANHIFGGGEYTITSQNFKGGQINSIFGGGKYDMTHSKLAPGVNVLDLSMIFGGLEILVPATWTVKIEVDSVLGGFSVKGVQVLQSGSESDGQLVIKGSAIFGGGELRRI